MDTLEITQEIQEKIDYFMELITRCRENGEFALFSALFQTDYQIVTYLSSHPSAHPSDMATALKSTRPNIAASLRVLEEKGYISREIDSDNRRQVYVNLTERGKRYYDICQKQLSMLFLSWFEILGREDTDNLMKILEKSSNPLLMTESLAKFSFGE